MNPKIRITLILTAILLVLAWFCFVVWFLFVLTDVWYDVDQFYRQAILAKDSQTLEKGLADYETALLIKGIPVPTGHLVLIKNLRTMASEQSNFIPIEIALRNEPSGGWTSWLHRHQPHVWTMRLGWLASLFPLVILGIYYLASKGYGERRKGVIRISRHEWWGKAEQLEQARRVEQAKRDNF